MTGRSAASSPGARPGGHTLGGLDADRKRASIACCAGSRSQAQAARRTPEIGIRQTSPDEPAEDQLAAAGVNGVAAALSAAAYSGTVCRTTSGRLAAMSITASEARKGLFPLIKKVNEDHDAIEIVSRHGNAFLVSAEDYAALREGAYLLRSPANARRLLSAYENALNGIRTAEHALIDPDADADRTR